MAWHDGRRGDARHPYGLQEDLGWNDMGYDVDPAHEERAPRYGNLLAGAIPDTAPPSRGPIAPGRRPRSCPMVRQQAEIAERLAEPVAVAEAALEAVPASEPVASEPVAPEPEPVPVSNRSPNLFSPCASASASRQ